MVAVLDNGKLIDLQAEARRQKRAPPFDASSMLALIKSGNAGLEGVRTVAEHALSRPASLLPIERARFMSPIPRPERNIYCVGWNYLDHFEEGKAARFDKSAEKLPEHPVFFTKGTHSMNGPFDTIPHDPNYSNTTDWEAELAVIIGVKLDDLRVICRVNGVEKQNASYKQMYFKIPRIIAELSRGLTLVMCNTIRSEA